MIPLLINWLLRVTHLFQVAPLNPTSLVHTYLFWMHENEGVVIYCAGADPAQYIRGTWGGMG